ncbi:MAG: hypothetical protein OEV30_07970, partial [Ignavibacteria bacterium]|nr:hypothetical protein [Ignavibacteria bacterium]
MSSNFIHLFSETRRCFTAGVLVLALFNLSGCKESAVQNPDPPDPGPVPDFWESMMLPSPATVQAIHAGDSSHVFAGTWGDGLLRTTDAGLGWENTTSGTADDILSITQCIDGSLVIGTDAAVYRSTDEGSSWELVLVTNATVRDVAVGETGDVVAVAFGRGLYRSTDNGITWAQLPNPPSDTFLCVVVSSGGAILAGTNIGVYRTTDLGASWETVFSTAAVNAPSDITPGIDGTLATGIGSVVYQSTNDGATWIEGTPVSASSVSAILMLPAR